MKMITVTGVVLLVISVASGAAIDKCHMEKMTDCGTPLSEYQKEIGKKYPSTEEQVDQICDKVDVAMKCVEDYQNKCMTPMQLQIMGFVTEGTLDVYNDFCNTDDSEFRKKYLNYAPCINNASESAEAKEQNVYLEASLEQLTELPNEKKLLMACCGYQWITLKSERMWVDKCGQDAVDTFRRVVEMAASSLPNVLCNGFDPEGPQCAEIMPAPGTQPKGTIKNSHVAQSFADLYL